MKSVSGGLATHLVGESLTLATLWRVTRVDGTVFTFTDHDRDISYGGEDYLAALGYQRAAVASGSQLAVDETELLGLLDAASIDEAELRAGLWDGATVRIFVVNHADLTQGELKVRKGTLGEVIISDDGSFRAELRGLAQPLQQTIGSLAQAECRADLGDARCGLDLSYPGSWTAQDTIATVTDSVTLVLTGTGTSLLADGWFDGGVAIWQTGDNAGVAREVVGWTQGTLTLELLGPPPFAPAPTDVLHIQSGCDKRWATCRDKFNNKLNFRGEPLVPGANALMGVPA
jgi:uncharacterized phage protein (TIGR02218 family)